jgi:polysaccharide biosynthesis transport protein
MTFNELLHVFWRRKLLIAAVTAAVIGLAYLGTKLVEPRYESTATLALSPQNVNNDLILFGTLDAIVPVYAAAATSHTTLDAAAQRLGRPVEGISVQTFKGTGLMKVKARSTEPQVAQQRAEAVAQALVERSRSGDVGLQSLQLTEIDKATVPTDPVFPRTRLTLLVGALLGLGLGLGAALLADNLTTRIETPDQLAHATGLPVYAEVPAENAVLKMHKVDDLAHSKRLRIVAEALRELRTNLLFSDDTIRSVVVTSPDGSHGKTTISFGLAVTFARTGTRTLLVDGDLRRGRLAELLEIERAPGLMDVLLDEVSLEGAVRETGLETLHVLTAGRPAGDPGEVLTNEFPILLARLEDEYEAIVIDATPVVPITDARVMARYADATVLVTSAGRTRRRQLKTAIDRLNLISVTPAAAVLNNSRKVRGSSYYTRPMGEGAEQLRPRSRTGGTASR